MTSNTLLTAIIINLIITSAILGLYHRNYYSPPFKVATVSLKTYTDEIRQEFADGKITREIALARLDQAKRTINILVSQGYTVWEQEGVLSDVHTIQIR